MLFLSYSYMLSWNSVQLLARKSVWKEVGYKTVFKWFNLQLLRRLIWNVSCCDRSFKYCDIRDSWVMYWEHTFISSCLLLCYNLVWARVNLNAEWKPSLMSQFWLGCPLTAHPSCQTVPEASVLFLKYNFTEAKPQCLGLYFTYLLHGAWSSEKMNFILGSGDC